MLKLRRGVVTMLMGAMILTLAAPASAKDMFMSKTSGQSAVADWTQFDGEPTGSPFGNVHVGSLYAYETSAGKADAFIWIEDFECPVGVHPWQDYEGVCSYKGFRHGWAFDIGFTMDKKLSAARLTGSFEMQAFAHDGTDPHGGAVPAGSPVIVPADVTWTGVGDLARSRSNYRWSDGTSTYSGQYQSTHRSAGVGGTIGAMGFDPANSSGWMSNFKEMSKSRNK